MTELRFRVLAAGLAVLIAATAAHAAPRAIPLYYRPFRIEQVALAPDGRHLAYVSREGTGVALHFLDMDSLEEEGALAIAHDVALRRWLDRTVNRAGVDALCWATPDLLVYTRRALDRSAPEPRAFVELRVVDPAGKNDRKLIDQDDLSLVQPPPLRLPPLPRGPAEKEEDEEASSVRMRPASTGSTLVTRPPRLLGVASNTPPRVLIEARGMLNGIVATDVFAVDVRGGKPVSVAAEYVSARFLYDREGRPRLEESPRVGPENLIAPQRFRYRPAGEGLKPWRDWERASGGEAAGGVAFEYDDKNHYGPRALPLAFGADPDVLYFASNVGRDTFGLYGLDLRARAQTTFAVDVPGIDLAKPGDVFSDRALVFERRGQLVGVRLDVGPRSAHWLDPELARVQSVLDGKFSGRRVEVCDWDDARRRFLVLVHGPSDPGRYYLFEPERIDGLTEILRCAPWLPVAALHRSEAFSFETAAGVRLAGHLTLPRGSRVDPAPLVLYCHDLPDGAAGPGFHRDAQALAELGFAVAELSYRGTSGFGRAHRDAVKAGFDRVPIEDLRAAAAWLAEHHRVSRRRVALMGEGFGGYLALRALQLYPNEFRCAVSFDGPTDLPAWLSESRKGAEENIARRRAFFDGELAAISLTREPERFTRPVFLVLRGRGGRAWPSQGRNLRDALERLRRPVEYRELADGWRGEPEERAELVTRVGEFLSEHLYRYTVEIGEEQEVK